MKVFVYKNGMCDPKAKLGTVKKLNKADEVDSFIKALCASMTPLAHRQFRIFLTNDEVEQHEVDHHALMGDNYGLDLRSNSIKEVNTLEVAADCSKKMARLYERDNQRIKMARG